MAFDPARFWSAFAAAGMLAEAAWQPAAGPAVPGIQVGLIQPDVAILEGLAQATDYEVEYQTADMPTLAMGDRLTIGGEDYKVRRPPEKQRDGYFSKAALTKL